MKKFYAFIFFITVNYAWSQDYLQMISTGDHTVMEIQQEAETYFAHRDKGRGTGYKQYKRWEYQALRNMDENGMLKTPSYYYNELERYNSYLNENFGAPRTTVGTWEELGPTYWDATSGTNPGVGRITSLAIDSNNTDHMIIGSQTGGIWKTLNGGDNWTVLTDNLPNINVYALAIDPLLTSTYFWGSNNGTIFKSNDGGSTWNLHSNAGNSYVNKILINYNNPSIMYCSVEHSGVYRSIDSGLSWTKIHPDITKGYDIEFKPGDTNIVYASGLSFYKSTDNGVTFIKDDAPFVFNQWTQEYILSNANWRQDDRNRDFSVLPKSGYFMAVFPSDNVDYNTRFVTTVLDLTGATLPQLKFSHTQAKRFDMQDELRVLYKTSITGNWIELAHYTTDIPNWQDEVIDLPNPSAEYYIAFEGLTTNGNWITLDDITIEDAALGIVFSENFESPISNNFSNSAKMIGVSEDDPSRVYVVEASSIYNNGKFKGIHKSDDSGETFLELDHSGTNYFGYSPLGDDELGQAPRDMDIAVNPNNADEVHIAGILTWRSTDGGANFSNTSRVEPQNAINDNIGYCHADVDLLKFVGSELYVCSDGGIFVAEDIANISVNYYRDLSTGLGIKQFYKLGLSQTNPTIVLGGSQDNGTSFMNTAGSWKDWLGQDGMECFVDKFNNEVFYGSHQYGNLYKSIDGGTSYIDLGSPEGKSGAWVTPFEQDPMVEHVIYAGYDEVYKSIDGGSSWASISQNFTQYLQHLKIAPSDNLTMYGTTNGSWQISNGALYKTTDGGFTDWTELPSEYYSGYNQISAIAIHPTNPNKVAVALNYGELVVVSIDGGTSWTSYKLNLPNLSALALTWQDNGKDGLYVGMSYGVYYIDNTYTEWQPFFNNLPNVLISELEINTANNKIYAATYGRGLWSSNVFDFTLSTQDNALNEITVYPNPASNTINIASNKDETVQIRIYNSLGKLLFYMKDKNLLNPLSIDSSQYASGLYFVSINNVHGAVTKKLIIE